MLSSSSNGSRSYGSTGEPQGELLKAAVPVSTKRLMKVENLISVLLVRYSFFVCYALLALRSCTMGRMIVIGASKMALFALLTPREDDDVVYVLSGYWSSMACQSACICMCV